MRYETTSICSAVSPSRADCPSSGAPLPRCLYPAPLPNPAPKRPGPTPLSDRRCLGLRQPNRPRRLCTPSPPRAWDACAKPKTPHTLRTAWPKDHDPDLHALLHQSPRALGKETSLWTLPLLAQLCHEKGWTPRRLSGETIRRVLKRLGVTWKRAKHWLSCPDPQYALKKLGQQS